MNVTFLLLKKKYFTVHEDELDKYMYTGVSATTTAPNNKHIKHIIAHIVRIFILI